MLTNDIIDTYRNCKRTIRHIQDNELRARIDEAFEVWKQVWGGIIPVDRISIEYYWQEDRESGIAGFNVRNDEEYTGLQICRHFGVNIVAVKCQGILLSKEELLDLNAFKNRLEAERVAFECQCTDLGKKEHERRKEEEMREIRKHQKRLAALEKEFT